MSLSVYSRETFNEVILRELCCTISWNRFRPIPHRPVTPSFAVFRLLLGGVDLTFSGKGIIQQNNYMAIGGLPSSSPLFFQKIKAAFPTLGEQNVNGDFLLRTAVPAIKKYLAEPGGNHGFFSSLFDELARAIWHLNNRQGLSAFVHLYRALEKLSFSFPLYHARQNKSYMKAYDQLKRYFEGGELKFCSNFIREILGNDPLAAEDVRKLKFSSNLSTSQNNYFSEHQKTVAITALDEIEIKMIDVFDFIVTLRNHYFHHLSGSNYSLESKVIPDPDIFFLPPTEVGLGLIGLVFGKMIVDAV